MPFWDIDINPTTDHQRACINAPSDGGVYVKKVFKKSLFEKATVQRGDILYQVNGFIIDRFGYLDAQWGIGRIELIDYLNRLNIGTEVSFSIYRNGECKKLCVIVQEPDPFKIMQIHSPYEKLPYYEVIGGFVVSELTVNHLFTFFDKFGDSLNPANENVALFARYAAADNRHKNRLIISAVLPDSPGDKTRCFTKSFDRIIDTVNNESVSTIEDFHNAVRKSIGKESLIITTEGGTTVTLSVADIVAAENSLQRRNEFYPQSPLIDELAKAVP
jgi:C-terminal processing protease CtpA/Prc